MKFWDVTQKLTTIFPYPLVNARFTMPPDGMPCLRDWVTTWESMVTGGIDLGKEPITVNALGINIGPKFVLFCCSMVMFTGYIFNGYGDPPSNPSPCVSLATYRLISAKFLQAACLQVVQPQTWGSQPKQII